MSNDELLKQRIKAILEGGENLEAYMRTQSRRSAILVASAVSLNILIIIDILVTAHMIHIRML